MSLDKLSKSSNKQNEKDSLIASLMPILRMLYSKEGRAVAVFCGDERVLDFVSEKQKFEKLSSFFDAEHDVYCKEELLFLDCIDETAKSFINFEARKGYLPKIVGIKDLGFVALGDNKENAEMTKAMFLGVINQASNPIPIEGSRAGQSKNILSADNTDTNIADISTTDTNTTDTNIAGRNTTKRLGGKIAIVTGGAQGFGKGIATELVKEGAYVVIADINSQGATSCSEELNNTYGKYATIALEVDVTCEESVEKMVNETVINYGGLDILIANAGVLKAGSVFEMTKDSFDFVTSVNYTGYFLCAKYAAGIMKIQNQYGLSYLTDIIEINSKSGLEGSNKNFAYAGSKFGGVGLTQSFALEFIEYGIKVNAICPGNLLDGPLWSDPEKGLFRQYLDAGKVKGAKTISDVRKYYEGRVPMGRGCEVLDVARAIFYIVEQQYETGQAIPVTGGQVMLG